MTFNSVSTDGVGENGGSTPCDINNGAGGEYIYMHIVKTATDDHLLVHNEAELNEAVTLCANIRVVDNITLTNVVDVYYPVTFSLDLYGHTIDRNLTASAGGSGHVLQVRGGSDVTLRDSQGGGKLTGGFADNGGGVWIGSTSTFTMESGTITVFRMVQVSNTPASVRYGGVTFSGTFSPKSLKAGDKTRAYLGADNKLYFATKDLNLNSFRCYFELDASISTRSLSGCVLDTGDNE